MSSRKREKVVRPCEDLGGVTRMKVTEDSERHAVFLFQPLTRVVFSDTVSKGPLCQSVFPYPQTPRVQTLLLSNS